MPYVRNATNPSIRNFFSLFLQSGDHVVETGALLHEVVDLLADGAVGGQRRVEVDHDAVEAVLEQADAVRHVVLVPGRRRRGGRRRRTASCLKLFSYQLFTCGVGLIVLLLWRMSRPRREAVADS